MLSFNMITPINQFMIIINILDSERSWSENLPEDDADFSPLASDLTPVRLGDLKHTKATLRLELPQLRPDQGEASILDSGIDTA